MREEDGNKTRPFDAYDGGARVYGAIAEVLKYGGSPELALEHGRRALSDLRGRLLEEPVSGGVNDG